MKLFNIIYSMFEKYNFKSVTEPRPKTRANYTLLIEDIFKKILTRILFVIGSE